MTESLLALHRDAILRLEAALAEANERAERAAAERDRLASRLERLEKAMDAERGKAAPSPGRRRVSAQPKDSQSDPRAVRLRGVARETKERYSPALMEALHALLARATEDTDERAR